MWKLIGVTALAVAFAGAAQAQTATYYGPNGQYRGQSQTNTFGNNSNTTYYGPSGQYQGQSQTNTFGNNSSSTLYGPSGQYLGNIQRTR